MCLLSIMINTENNTEILTGDRVQWQAGKFVCTGIYRQDIGNGYSEVNLLQTGQQPTPRKVEVMTNILTVIV